MAAGKVTTGFSKPYVAVYSVTGTTVSYSNGQILARGVDVNIVPESSSDNNFYADNILAETEAGRFTRGTVTLTVDGLMEATRKLIFGLPTASADGWYAFGDDMEVPYVGIGFIIRQQNEGVVTYTPVVLAKCKFNLPEDSAATQGESIEWQTESLEAVILRADDENHNWKYLGAPVATEALAEAALQAKLGI